MVNFKLMTCKGFSIIAYGKYRVLRCVAISGVQTILRFGNHLARHHLLDSTNKLGDLLHLSALK